MDAIVIYESLTGNTRKAGEAIAGQLTAAGVPTVACPITAVDYGALSRAELVVVGSWVDGFIVVGQRPGRIGRIENMPALAEKKAAVYVRSEEHTSELQSLMRISYAVFSLKKKK